LVVGNDLMISAGNTVDPDRAACLDDAGSNSVAGNNEVPDRRVAGKRVADHRVTGATNGQLLCRSAITKGVACCVAVEESAVEVDSDATVGVDFKGVTGAVVGD